jgi:HK97 gp10 family phage protein
MADGIKVTVTGMPELMAALEAVGAAARGEMLGRAVMAGALPVQNAAKLRAPVRTRTLSRSIHAELAVAREAYAEAVVGTDVEYAAIQEFGGVITPVNGQYLAIPLTKAAEAAVSPRSFGGELRPVFRGLDGVLVDEAGEAQFALRRSVTIPAHPYLRPALDENEDAARGAMGAALRQQIEAAE